MSTESASVAEAERGGFPGEILKKPLHVVISFALDRLKVIIRMIKFSVQSLAITAPSTLEILYSQGQF